MSAPHAASQILGAQAGDLQVEIYTTGPAQVRIGFAEADVTQVGSGFAIPRDGVRFLLAAGDEVWAAGDESQWETRLYMLATKG
jgi:hypothetical protein